MKDVRTAVMEAVAEQRKRMRAAPQGMEGCSTEALCAEAERIGERHGVDTATIHTLLGEALWGAPSI